MHAQRARRAATLVRILSHYREKSVTVNPEFPEAFKVPHAHFFIANWHAPKLNLRKIPLLAPRELLCFTQDEGGRLSVVRQPEFGSTSRRRSDVNVLLNVSGF
jgi:hypothetical protein